MWKGIHAAVELGVLRLSMDDGWARQFNEVRLRICGLKRCGDSGGLHQRPVYLFSHRLYKNKKSSLVCNRDYGIC